MQTDQLRGRLCGVRGNGGDTTPNSRSITHIQHHDDGRVVCGKPQVITRASKQIEDEVGRGVYNWLGEWW